MIFLCFKFTKTFICWELSNVEGNVEKCENEEKKQSTLKQELVIMWDFAELSAF